MAIKIVLPEKPARCKEKFFTYMERTAGEGSKCKPSSFPATGKKLPSK
jgi:hypothetical protein